MATINIFFNGDDVALAPQNDWEKFKGLDTMRLFAVCAESWRRHGWEVRRFRTSGDNFPRIVFDPAGECAKSFHWYAERYWQYTAAAAQVTKADPERLQLFCCMDVINYGFRPEDCPLGKSVLAQAVNFQAEHFSLSLIAANHFWWKHADQVLQRYDRGELPALNRTYTSDETILRNYAQHVRPFSTPLRFAGHTYTARLLHFARTTMAPYLADIPESLPL